MVCLGSDVYKLIPFYEKLNKCVLPLGVAGHFYLSYFSLFSLFSSEFFTFSPEGYVLVFWNYEHGLSQSQSQINMRISTQQTMWVPALFDLLDGQSLKWNK